MNAEASLLNSPSRLGAVYRTYLRAPTHPCKLRFLRILEKYIFPEQGLPFDVDGGIRLYAHPKFSAEYNLIKGNGYQKSLNSFVDQNIRPGDTVVIGGVSFGQQAILASRAVGQGGHVVAVDPAPHALLRAQSNLGLNKWTGNVHLVSAALGASRSIAAINPLEDVQHASLVKPSGSVPIYVLIETVPHILEGLNLTQLDILLLDVIGYEIPVLMGISEPYLPRLITVAIHPWPLEKTGTSLKDYTELLERMGYDCYTLEGCTAESVDSLRGCQLIAVKKGSPLPHWLEKDPAIPFGQFNV